MQLNAGLYKLKTACSTCGFTMKEMLPRQHNRPETLSAGQTLDPGSMEHSHGGPHCMHVTHVNHERALQLKNMLVFFDIKDSQITNYQEHKKVRRYSV